MEEAEQQQHRSDHGLREPQPDGSQDISHSGRSPEGVPAGHDPLSLVNLADCKRVEIVEVVLRYSFTSFCPKFLGSNNTVHSAPAGLVKQLQSLKVKKRSLINTFVWFLF